MNSKQLVFNTIKLILVIKIHSSLFRTVGCKVQIYNMFSTNNEDRINNASRILYPPKEVKGMTVFDKKAFEKVIAFPALCLKMAIIKDVKNILHRDIVRLLIFKPVVDADNETDFKYLLLNPDTVHSFDSLGDVVIKKFEQIQVTKKNFVTIKKTVCFDNWKMEDLLNSVLPNHLNFSGYTIVGHIAHLNLRPELMDYKYVIGNIILNKMKMVETVVNKLDIIDNKFRNFKMEIICGKNKFVTTLKENGCVFELDFSTVYWNSRLSTEHEKIVRKFDDGDIVYDLFAGVGPFSIPAAKKGCIVLANDLNPDAVKWLKENIYNNQIDKSKYLHVYNKDAKDFIFNDLKKHLLGVVDYYSNYMLNVHIIMNLPAMAVDFLEYFKGLLTLDEYMRVPKSIYLYVYCFVRHENRNRETISELAKNLIMSRLGDCVENQIIEVHHVRHVSTSKDMYRVTVKLDDDVLVRRGLKRPASREIVEDYVVTEKHKQFFD